MSTILNGNTTGSRTRGMNQRELMQELTPGDVNFGKIRVGVDGDIANEVLLATSNDIKNLHKDIVGKDGIVSGYEVGAAASGLDNTITSGVRYVDGERYEDVEEVHTYTASKDTYVFVNPTTGVYTYEEVANGDAAPATPADTVPVATVVTDASDITSTTKTVEVTVDSLGKEDIGVTVQAYDVNIVSDASYVATANDFTTALKDKLDAIEASATADQTKADIDALDINAAEVNSHTVEEDVPSGAVFTDTTYSVTDGELSEYNLTAARKDKVDGMEEVVRDTIGSALTAGTNMTVVVDDAGDTITLNGAEIVDNVTSTDTDKTLSANQGKVLKDAVDAKVANDSAQSLASDADVLTISDHDITLKRGDGTTDVITVPDTDTTYSVEDGGLTEINFTTARKDKVDYLTVTAATDLDDLRTRVAELDQAVVLKGEFDASTGDFPTSTDSGQSWIISVAGTIDSVDFEIGDRIIAIVDSASTSTYADNWLKQDYTDKISSVAGRTGAVVLTSADVSLDNLTNDAQVKIASNLSDLDNAATSRENLGVKIGTDVQAYSADTVVDANYVATANDFTTTLKDKLDGVATDANKYEHPTTAGNKHIPAGGSADQVLTYDSDGVAVWADPAASTTDEEVVRDTIGAALVGGTNITVTVDDGADTITVVNDLADLTVDGAGTVHANNYTDTTYAVGDGGLTTKDFTQAKSDKLDGIASSATNTVDLTVDGAGTVHANNYTDTTYSVEDGGLTEINFTTARKDKVDYLTVTAATDLDDLRTRVAELDQAVVLKGSWDVSAGDFPTSTDAGQSWIASSAGTIDSVDFEIGDRIIAIVDNAPTDTYTDKWLKLDYSDKITVIDNLTSTDTANALSANQGKVLDDKFGTHTHDTLANLTKKTLVGRKTDSDGVSEELSVADVQTLINVADGATANDTDANLKDRTNHTGTQAVSTLTDVTSTAAELNILDGVTSTTAELNILDGITATTAELNYVDGVTSAIQTQIDGKEASDATISKTGVANTFTKTQRGSIEALADDTVAIDFRLQNNYSMTMTADADITLATDGTVGCVGQGGILTITTAEHITGWGAEFKFKNTPTDLTGVERFGYFVEATDSIAIGRVN